MKEYIPRVSTCYTTLLLIVDYFDGNEVERRDVKLQRRCNIYGASYDQLNSE